MNNKKLDEDRLWVPLKEAERGLFGELIYINDLYQINARQHDEGVVHLSIKRRDKAPVRNWRHFQYIKNELCGEETCGIEVYPPESQLVDAANQYHMWVMHKDCMPAILFNERLVCEESFGGSIQERWEKNMRPKDLISKDEMVFRINKLKKEMLDEF